MSQSLIDRVAKLEARVLELERQVGENTRYREQNVHAIRAILTHLHPDDDHPTITDEVIPNGEWLHSLVMYWIDQYGGRIPVGEVE